MPSEERRERKHDKDGHRHRHRDRSRSRDRDRERSSKTHDRREDKERRHKHHHREETEEERRERKRAKRDGRDRHKHEDGEDMWVEKGIDATDAVSYIPTSDSLPLRSHASAETTAKLPHATVAAEPERQSWMVNDEPDLFASFGTERPRKEEPVVPKTSKYELNTQLKEGKGIDEYAAETKKKVLGGPGHQWRMMKLKRMQEQATEQNRPVEEVALERYGSLDEYHEALEERRFLDNRGERDSTPSTGQRTPAESSRKYMFTEEDGYFSRPASRSGFRKPGEVETPSGSRVSQLRSNNVSTPIPSVFTPVISRGVSAGALDAGTVSRAKPVLGIAELNRMQAAVLRAKLSDAANAAELEEEYDYERMRYEGRKDDGTAGMYEGGHAGLQGQMGREEEYDERGNKIEVQVLPTLDGHGRLYDVGIGRDDGYQDHSTAPGGKKKRKKEPKFETHDKEGNIIRYNADDDEQTLGELVRQERFGGGASEQKILDAEFAGAIARDARFADDHDYLDENAERLARRKMKSDAMKRQFAINDFARTKKALDSCPFCYQEERNPLTAVVALGTRTYMCCTLTEELVPGHCLIVPIQHYMSSLEMDDEDWEEVKNFMKCLMRMYAKDNKGVLFFETILSFRQQRHTYIEAVPVPFDQFQDCPAYFRESILASESEWSQHKKLIDFSARPGGFRRSLVSTVPYFAVMWDYKGEKGYGHVIEGEAENAGTAGNDEGEGGVYEGDKGGMGGFPPYFAGEVIGNVLGLEPRKWLRPRQIDRARNLERAKAMGQAFQPYNWTLQLQVQ